MVFDVHVYINAAIGPDSEYPLIKEVPPSTSNASADCLSIAFDGDYELYISPHIIKNISRVLGAVGWSEAQVKEYLEFIAEVVSYSGGAVIDPPRVAHSSRDHEDNLILDLVAEVEADVLVSDDTDLTPLSPWRATPILRPHQFVERVVRERRTRH
ncbi:putative toxin-antitoxin system toxin component, PIN family [Agromyces sp. NPDC057679]|uniref:putative toxin-antitoxin system toxin component, PIN family n=1 Tax=Agromyces sp. NPDC057679 TaxID=3346207 RepID=UPI00366B2F2C